MSNTETLRAAAANALDVLDEARTYTSSEAWSPSMTEECDRAIRLLQSALAHPAASGEPVAWHMRVIGCDGSADWCELGAKPPEPVQGVEALPMMYSQPATPDAQKGEP